MTTRQWKSATQFFKKNIPLTLFERFVCERELENERNCNLLIHNRVSFPFTWAAQPEAWGPSPLGAVLFTKSCL